MSPTALALTTATTSRSRRELALNGEPNLAVLGDPARFLTQLAELRPAGDHWAAWRGQLRTCDAARNAAIEEQAYAATSLFNLRHLCPQIDAAPAPDGIVIGGGGDFAATAAYVLQPYGPPRWLNPSAFGTSGVGAGFAFSTPGGCTRRRKTGSGTATARSATA